MEINSIPEKAYINTNPFTSKTETNKHLQKSVISNGKRPRIQKPVYTVRFL